MTKKLIFLAVLLALFGGASFAIASHTASAYSYGYGYGGGYYGGSGSSNCGCSQPVQPTPPPPPPAPALEVTCSANTTYAQTGTTVTWTATVTGGSGNYGFSWTGSNGLSGSTGQTSTQYSSAGQQTATVNVTSGSQNVSASCVTTTYAPYVPPAPPVYNPPVYNPPVYNPPVYNPPVYNPPVYIPPVYTPPPVQQIVYQAPTPITAACSANTTYAPAGTTITWTATISGGNSFYGNENYNYAYGNGYNTPYDGSYGITWNGTDGLSASASSIVSKTYVTAGEKVATITVYEDGQSVTASCDTIIAAPVIAYGPTQPQRVYLNQVPYTGEGSVLKVSLFMAVLLAWSGLVAWVILKRRNSSTARLAAAGITAAAPVSESQSSGNFLNDYVAKLRGQVTQ